MIDLFGLQIPTVAFVIAIIVILALVIAIPIYKGYKKEMESPAKKSGSKKSGSSKKK